MERVLAVLLQVGMCGWVAVAWVRWWGVRGAEKQGWRMWVLLVAFLASTFSLCVAVALSVHAHVHGGYRFMEYPQVVLMYLAFFATPIAIVGALIGKGQPRWTAVACAVFSAVALMVEYRAN